VLCVCTSSYPTETSDVNIRKITTLRHAFESLVIGFSDHTVGTVASVMAVALGASLFEKHFTLDNNLDGPDHWFSENPVGLAEWSNSIKTAWEMKGRSIVLPTKNELEMRTLARRTIVALEDISPGDTFSHTNIGLRRAGAGLPIGIYDFLLGKRCLSRIAKSKILTRDDF